MADAGPDLFASLRDVLRSPGATAGVTARATLAAEPAGSTGHSGLSAWEARWLAWLSERLRADLGDEAGVPWTVAAALVTALVEGSLLVRGPRLAGSVVPLDEPYAGLVADVAADAVAFVREHIAGPDVVLEATQHPVTRTPGAERLLARVVEAVDAGDLLAGRSDDLRVLSPKVLAAELGVSERWVFGCWPTSADFNAELFGESLRRLNVVTDEASLRAFSEATITDPSDVNPVLLRINEALMDLDDLVEPRVLLSLMDLLELPEVGSRHAELIQQWCAGNQLRAAAIVGATGRRFLPHVDIPDFTDLVVAAGVGAWRLCATHRDLLVRRSSYLGEEYLSVAAALDAITQVCVTAMDPGPE